MGKPKAIPGLIPDFQEEAGHLLAGVKEELDHGESESAELTIRQALVRMHLVGVRRFAWWKDGEERVGTCGTTYLTARHETLVAAGFVTGREESPTS